MIKALSKSGVLTNPREVVASAIVGKCRFEAVTAEEGFNG